MDKKLLALSKKYTNETVKGAGAIKGSPCYIKEQTDIEGGTRITFGWTLTDGTEKTSSLDVMNGKEGKDGKQGAGIELISVDGTTLTILYDDGEATTAEIPTVKGDKGDSGEVGQTGADGKSAYECAVEEGYSGTEEEWLLSLKGEQGDKGDTGLSIKSVDVNASNHLIITYDDDTTKDAGEIKDITTTLANISDFSVTNPEDGQTLKYNATTQKWENTSGQAVDTSLIDLTDVNVSDVQDGQTIVWDSTTNRWVNGNSSTVGELDDLEDVNVSSVANNDTLVFNAETGKWENSNNLSNKVDKEAGKGLSANDFTDTLKTKLDGVENDAQENVIEEISINGTSLEPTDKKIEITVITNAVSDLINYYLKTETYSKTEVDNIVAAIKNSRFELVSKLPTEDIKTNVIYLVPKSTAKTSDIKDEYINLDGTSDGWERIGSTDIDLSDVVTTEALNAILSDYATTEYVSEQIDTVNTALADKVSWDDYSNLGAVNLMPNNFASKVTNGIIFTANEDGTVNATGTNTGVANADCTEEFTLGKGTYKLLGCPADGGEYKWRITLRIGESPYTFAIDDGDGKTFEILQDDTAVKAYCVVTSSYTTEVNLTFKPMITSVSYNASYVPYAKTNKELTDDVISHEHRIDAIETFDTFTHNIPRLVPKDITSYVSDGSLWKRLNGTDGYSFCEDIYVGDYFKMSRAISAHNQDSANQVTGSQYVTIAGIDWYMGNGSTSVVDYHHLVMVAGQGFGGTQHFGKARMNSTNVTTGGYLGSDMVATILGAVATSGSTASTATINQQLYAEFGTHLKTMQEIVSKSVNNTQYNRYGTNTGGSNGWTTDSGYTPCQAVLMSEIEVYGSIVWSSSGYDTGLACRQLPLFAHNKQAQNNRSVSYWLKDVASASYFCGCSHIGNASASNASYSGYGVRPRFILA